MRAMSTTRKPANRKVLNFAADADNSALANLAGALDNNLRQIETELDVEIKRRGHQFRIEGDATHAQQAIAVLEHFLGRASRPISIDDIQLYFVELRGATAQPSAANDGERLPELHT